MRRDLYSGFLKLNGDEHRATLHAAYNYANGLLRLQRFEEAKSLMRRTMPVTRRVLGENHEDTLKLRWSYAAALYMSTDATLDDLRESVETLEDTVRIARRVFGSAHPLTTGIEVPLRKARAALSTREDLSAVRAALHERARGRPIKNITRPAPSTTRPRSSSTTPAKNDASPRPPSSS